MEKPRNLMEFNSNEITNFLNSFDTIITDCDGVLWLGNTPIAGAIETLKQLQNIGKNIIFVSNNSTQKLEDYCAKLRCLGFEATADQITIPSTVVCWYLKKRGFNGKALVLGTDNFRQVLRSDGIDVVEPGPDHLEERVEVVYQYFKNSPPVDAVIVDLDVNINWAKMSRAIKCLKQSEVLYIAGALDRKFPVGKSVSLLGIGPFVDIISKECNRQPIHCAKPGKILKNYVIEKYGITDPSRCIFIGDSLENDMNFADKCGFGKLWVGSGIDTPESIAEFHQSNAEAHFSPPDFYIPSLGHLSPLLFNSSLRPLQSNGHSQKQSNVL